MIEHLLSARDFVGEIKRIGKIAVMYGTGDGADKITDFLTERQIYISDYFVSDDRFREDAYFRGKKVCNLSQICDKYSDFIIISAFGAEKEETDSFKSLSRRYDFFAPNLPVIGSGRLDADYINANREKISQINGRLSDDISRSIFANLLEYNITAKIEALFRDDIAEAMRIPDGFYTHDKIHIDIGAYDGDTVAEFISYNKNYSKIYAVEPDKKTFARLIKATAAERDVVCINAAAGKHSGEINFFGGNGRASKIGSNEQRNNAVPIQLISVDGLCGQKNINTRGEAVGSIKIDAEGHDAEVIAGAANTMYVSSCNVCVSLYHRAYDLIDIPYIFCCMNPKYELYMRKIAAVPAWDVFLYVKINNNF